jgi:hypothetical protein
MSRASLGGGGSWYSEAYSEAPITFKDNSKGANLFFGTTSNPKQLYSDR